MSTGPAFRIQDLTAGYGERTALDAVSLDVGFGATTVLVGPGGGGKSTLLKLLAGALKPGDRVGLYSDSKGPHDPDPFWLSGLVMRPDLPVAHLRQRDLPTARTARSLLTPRPGPGQIEEFLRRTWSPAKEAGRELLNLLDVPLERLSAPQLALVRFSFAITRRTPQGRLPVLLLDEPDAGLSDAGLDWVIAKLNERRGRQTIVLATHHLRLAREVGDYVAFFVYGELVEKGKAAEFFASPCNPRTQYFVRMGG